MGSRLWRGLYVWRPDPIWYYDEHRRKRGRERGEHKAEHEQTEEPPAAGLQMGCLCAEIT
jgi:hypothetical protein